MIRLKKNIIALKFLLVSWVFIFSINNWSAAQDQKGKLEENKKKLEEEILFNSRLLEETQKTKKSSLNQFVIIKNQISTREELIDNLNDQIAKVDEELKRSNETLAQLNTELASLKSEYATMIYYAYKNRNSIDRLMFIFSSRDFNQAYRRLKYFQQYSVYRKTQVMLIENTTHEINQTVIKLEAARQEKFALLNSIEEEKVRLNREKNQQSRLLLSLSQKETELQEVIKEKERAAKKLEKEIEKLINEEIKLASGKSGTTLTGLFALTPEEAELSADFTANQGGLPWPVERGLVAGSFGEHPHPVLKNVITKNNGIDVVTDENSKARAVFEGEVTRVMSIPSYNYVIMIRHGEYLTVYSNLDEVFVEKGEKVKTKQEIGRVYTNQKDTETKLHFEIWKGKSLLNPESWLAR